MGQPTSWLGANNSHRRLFGVFRSAVHYMKFSVCFMQTLFLYKGGRYMLQIVLKAQYNSWQKLTNILKYIYLWMKKAVKRKVCYRKYYREPVALLGTLCVMYEKVTRCWERAYGMWQKMVLEPYTLNIILYLFYAVGVNKMMVQ